jgi:hypothetical protein
MPKPGLREAYALVTVVGQKLCLVWQNWLADGQQVDPHVAVRLADPKEFQQELRAGHTELQRVECLRGPVPRFLLSEEMLLQGSKGRVKKEQLKQSMQREYWRGVRRGQLE